MKRLWQFLLAAVAACAGLACADPTAPPTGEYRLVTICTMTIGDAAPTCLPTQRCWLTYADRTFHCPSGDYTPATPNRRGSP